MCGIILLSAYEDPALQKEAKGAGASVFLVKGCTASEIIDAVSA